MHLSVNDPVMKLFTEPHRFGHHRIDDVWGVVTSRGVARPKDLVKVVCTKFTHFA